MGKCSNGVLGTLAEAIGEMEKPSVKATRPYKTYDGPLTLGGPESNLSINIERYFLTKLARPPAATTVVVRSDGTEGAEGTQSTHTIGPDDVEMGNADFTAVRSARAYTVENPTRVGGRREVDFEALEKGYEYGRTAVHISATDQSVTQLNTTKEFSIVGFITKENVSLFPFIAAL